MELTPKQQTIELVRTAQKILLLSHVNPDGDALGSILASMLVLKKLGKEVTAVVTDPVPNAYQFLPNRDDLTKEFSGTKDFVITVNTSKTRVDKLGYKNLPQENKLNIVITPLEGGFTPDDVTFTYGAFKFDLIIVLDSPDLERLGEVYDKHAELFYETPIVNIDHHAGEKKTAKKETKK